PSFRLPKNKTSPTIDIHLLQTSGETRSNTTYANSSARYHNSIRFTTAIRSCDSMSMFPVGNLEILSGLQCENLVVHSSVFVSLTRELKSVLQWAFRILLILGDLTNHKC